MENLAIVVHTCDHYNFCWKPFFFYFCKFFELHKYNGKIYFLNEEEDIRFEEYVDLKYVNKFIQVKTGKCLDEQSHSKNVYSNVAYTWSQRLINGLSNIKEENIIYLQEDYWFNKPFSINELLLMYNFFIKHDCNSIRFNNYNNYNTQKCNKFIENLELEINTTNSNFIFSHASAIWKKSFLFNLLVEGENLNENENRGHVRLKDKLKNGHGLNMYHIDFPEYYCNSYYHGKLGPTGIKLEKDMENIYQLNNNSFKFINNQFIDNFIIINNELIFKLINNELDDNSQSKFKSFGIYFGLFYNRFKKFQNYELSFDASSTINEIINFKIYTGILWKVIDIPIKKHKNTYVLKDIFNFENASLFRIGLTKFVKNTEFNISNVTLTYLSK